MKFQDVIRTGKPFRIRGEKHWRPKLEPGLKVTLTYDEATSEEWEVKRDPVVFIATVINGLVSGDPLGAVASEKLISIVGKKVRVTVEVLE